MRSNFGTFKYYGFFVSSLGDLLSFFNVVLSDLTLNIVLPVGISFYTFQTLSYVWVAFEIERQRIPLLTGPGALLRDEFPAHITQPPAFQWPVSRAAQSMSNGSSLLLMVT